MSYRNPTTCQAIIYAGKYLILLNRSKAFKQTFPNTRASAKTIHECASRFHQLRDVQHQIWSLRMLSKTKVCARFVQELKAQR